MRVLYPKQASRCRESVRIEDYRGAKGYKYAYHFVVGDMGSTRIMAYTAIGSHVNLGSRMESKAPIDGVLVSAPVYHAVKDAVSARFFGRITAKGISEEFETWEVAVP
ncbi:MAG: adenylate/guanylate cyclase domain-containing protein [Spirochaetia bacterium]|jgi:class 3 adenylate cyclase